MVIVLVAACAYLGGGQDTAIRTTIVLSWGLAAAVLAELLRTRADRAEDRRKALLQQQKRAQAEQQLELARDLHDSVAHALTAITVQAALAEEQLEHIRTLDIAHPRLAALDAEMEAAKRKYGIAY